MRALLLGVLAGVALLAGCRGTDDDGPWRRLAPAPLSPRSGHSAVWTGKEMIVWGGSILDAKRGPGDRRRAAGYSYHPETRRTTLLVTESYADGAAYDAVSDSWTPLPAAPLDARGGHIAVWTGKEMLVWGGSDMFDVFADGAAYDPRTRRWRTLARPSFLPTPAAAVWTEQELILWSGVDHRPDLPAAGAAYDPGTDSWRRIARFPLRPRQWHSAVWTGEEVIVWGGTDLVRPDYADGAAYDPDADRWRVLPPAPIDGRYRHGGVWTGAESVFWGGQVGPLDADDGAAYDPRRNRWRRLPRAPLAGRHWSSLVATDGAVIVWGGHAFVEVSSRDRNFRDGAAFDVGTRRWRRLPAGPLTGRCGHSAIWTGRELVIWGGTEACGTYGHARADGAAYRLPT